jgi:sarcosine oxidase subunit beta
VLGAALGVTALAVLGGRARARPRGPDVVVVGGGLYGLGLAWELGRRGARVVVLEAARIASGASGGPGRRGVRSNGREVRQLPLMPIAQRRWRRLARVLGDRRIFARVGHLHLIESEADLPAAEAQVRRQEAHGVRTRLVTGDELRRLEPALAPQVIAAMYAPDDGASDHEVTTRALARAARRRGVRIVRGARVVGFEAAGGRVAAVVTARGTRVAVGGELVVAANAGTADLLSSALGLRLPLFNVLPHVLVTAAVRPAPARHVIGHVRRRLAMKVLPGGRVMITGGWLGRVNPDTGRGEPVDAEIAGNLAEAVAVYPGLAGVRLALAVADRFEAVTPDLLPIVDRVPGAANVVVATGWSGQGWAPAPAYLALLAAWLRGGRKPELLAPFALDRFGTS